MKKTRNSKLAARRRQVNEPRGRPLPRLRASVLLGALIATAPPVSASASAEPVEFGPGAQSAYFASLQLTNLVEADAWVSGDGTPTNWPPREAGLAGCLAETPKSDGLCIAVHSSNEPCGWQVDIGQAQRCTDLVAGTLVVSIRPCADASLMYRPGGRACDQVYNKTVDALG